MAETDQSDDVSISSKDQFVLGGPGADTFHWAEAARVSNTGPGAHPAIIDGGAGIDTLFLPGSVHAWYWTTNGAETDLYRTGGQAPVADLFGVEYLHFQNYGGAAQALVLLSTENAATSLTSVNASPNDFAATDAHWLLH